MSLDKVKPYAIEDLLEVMASLRDPETGCPWDLKQTFASILPFTLEECYELADSIDRQDFSHMEEELGDVLFQVVFYARLGQEGEHFDFQSVVHRLTDKLIKRHPHVFPQNGELANLDEQQVKVNWEATKRREREAKTLHGLLDDVPLALPALVRAAKLQKRAATVGFDWQCADQVLAKVREELDELEEAIENRDLANMELELGDVLFSCVNLCRHLKLNPESALRASNQKFEQRIRHMECSLAAQKSTLQEAEPEQMELLWEQSKRAEKG